MEVSRNVVRLTGDLDIYHEGMIRASLESVRGPAVVDLSTVTYLDSTMLNELARLRKRVDDCTLVVGSPQVRRVLALVGFSNLFRIVDELQQP